MNRKELIEVIKKAFEGVVQPSDITIHVGKAYYSYDYSHDSEHRKKDFVGNWLDIPSDHIRQCQSALCYVNKVGMRYYLPAYMVWYLNCVDAYDELNNDSTLYALDNHPTNALGDYFKERFSLFNAEQLNACALFIKYCATSPEMAGYSDIDFAQEKYEGYWSQFEKT